MIDHLIALLLSYAAVVIPVCVTVYHLWSRTCQMLEAKSRQQLSLAEENTKQLKYQVQETENQIRKLDKELAAKIADQ